MTPRINSVEVLDKFPLIGLEARQGDKAQAAYGVQRERLSEGTAVSRCDSLSSVYGKKDGEGDPKWLPRHLMMVSKSNSQVHGQRSTQGLVKWPLYEEIRKANDVKCWNTLRALLPQRSLKEQARWSKNSEDWAISRDVSWTMPRQPQSTDHLNFPHAKNAGYARGCRCVECKKAHAEDVRVNWLKNHPEQRHTYRKHGGDFDHPDFPHGWRAGYLAGCRCDMCADANAIYNKAYDLENRRVGGKGYAKKAAANTTYRKSEKGIVSSRKGNATRAARKKGASIGTGPDEQLLIRLIYAHCPDGYEVDHIVPLSKGGAHVSQNLQYLPLTINRQKRDLDDFDYEQHVIKWQSILETPSTIIPQGSRGKRSEVRQTLQEVMI